jgi:hypothetical protein
MTGRNFWVLGSDTRRITKFLGGRHETFEEALTFQDKATKDGWKNVRIYDGNLKLLAGTQTFQRSLGE